jgi:hypothetical protein
VFNKQIMRVELHAVAVMVLVVLVVAAVLVVAVVAMAELVAKSCSHFSTHPLIIARKSE